MYIAAVTSAAVAVGGVKLLLNRKRKAQVDAIKKRQATKLKLVQSQYQGDLDAALARAERLKERLEKQLNTREKEIQGDEEAIRFHQEAMERRKAGVVERDDALAERFASLKQRQAEASELREEISRLEQAYVDELERAAGQPRSHALDELTQSLIGGAQVAAQKAAQAYDDLISDKCHSEARRIMEIAMSRYGTPLAANRLIATVSLPENQSVADALLADDAAVFQALHKASEVEFVDQGEGIFYLQAPDPFTREVGRLAFERMVKTGKVSEGIATSAVDKARSDLDKIARDAGRRAARLLKVDGVDPEILYLVGKLLYRTSYTQNQWQHAIETAHLCGMMAEDMGLDVITARRAALMHDIGKVLWAETEAVGSHAVSGAAFAAAHGEAPEIVHPIAAHHADEKPSTPLAHLVAAADALSGARPGARRETLEAYTQRVDDIEAICSQFANRGIQRSYVIQGGREVRIEVDPRRVNDQAAARLSNDIARNIEETCIYPGQIKVTVLRETLASSFARS